MIYDSLRLDGRVSVITGGTGHLGLAMADALAEVGSDIVLVDIDGDRTESLAQELAGHRKVRCLGIGCDLADDTATRDIPRKVEEHFGRLDILINNAAFVGTSGLDGWATSFEKQSAETWRMAMDVNLTAAFVLTQACRNLLIASGRASIINVASIYGVLGPDWTLYDGTEMANPAAYAASKGGLIQFTRWCATTLGPEIRVNSISPGGINRGQPDAFTKRYISKTPLKRMAVEDDFKGAIVFLAGDLSAYITGQDLLIDGGFSAW